MSKELKGNNHHLEKINSVSRFSPMKSLLIINWNPHPLERPILNPEFLNLSSIERCSEVISFNIKQFLYWISPSGNLFEFLRHTIVLFIILFFPIFLAIIGINYVLDGLENMLSSINGILTTALSIVFRIILLFAIYNIFVLFITKNNNKGSSEI